MEPRLTAAVLVAGTAVLDPAAVAHAVGAQIYGPEFEYLDEHQAKLARTAGVRVSDPCGLSQPAKRNRDSVTAYPAPGVRR